jgi:SagB-type dehydrogenase family enzyme
MTNPYLTVPEVADGYRLDSPAEIYHENSKIRRLGSVGGLSSEALHAMSHGFKVYGSAPTVELPPPLKEVPMNVAEAICKRRSVREYAPYPLSMESISTILFAAYGVLRPGQIHRSVPSGGGLFPMELYVGVLKSDNLASGAYHYDVRNHRLEQIPGRSDVTGLRNTIFVPEAAASASIFLAVTAVFGRSRIKYGERAYRFALMESGHIMQNVALICTALSIGFCPFGGFVDDEVNDVFGLDGLDEGALYLGALGSTIARGD